VPLIYIRDILGHVSVITTEIYAKVDVEEKRKALEDAYKVPSQDIIPNCYSAPLNSPTSALLN
jgi:hypothetical protein